MTDASGVTTNPGEFIANDFALDDISLQAGPEPTRLIPAALGLVGLAGYAGWRRSRYRGQ